MEHYRQVSTLAPATFRHVKTPRQIVSVRTRRIARVLSESRE